MLHRSKIQACAFLVWLAITLPSVASARDDDPIPPLIEGVIWQPDHATINPFGQWDLLGARRLLIQWTIADNISFVPGTSVDAAVAMPDWSRIAKEPWATEVIMGLAGHFDEALSRKDLPRLLELSQQLTQLKTPLKVVGWYFPVEVDPTWQQAGVLKTLLNQLPRPLWISVYDSANWGGETLADSLAAWLPDDVGVFFQDGVGVHARTASVALTYAEALVARLGRHRVKVIAEAFRPNGEKGFRAATSEELLPQLKAYKKHDVYLFDGPHYVSDVLVHELRQAVKPHGKLAEN